MSNKLQTSASPGWLADLKTKLDENESYSMFLDDFSLCKSDESRVKMVYQLPTTSKLFAVDKMKNGKNVEESVQLREEGNATFKKRQYKRTLDLYNRSVCMAPTSGDTSVLALAYANRSAVLCHIKLYKACLLDIQSALDYGYPESLRHKLYDRRGKCHYQLNNEEEAKQAFKKAKQTVLKSGLDQTKMNNLINTYDKEIWQCESMSEQPQKNEDRTQPLYSPIPNIEGNANKQIPVVSDCVDIGYCEESGRGLFAQRDIEVGEVIIVEKPYASTVLSNFKSRFCNNCCKRVVAPVPCLSCSGVVYCDETCRNDAWENFHQYECDIYESILKPEITLGPLALRSVIKAGYKHLSEYDGKSSPDLTKIPLNDDNVYDNDEYNTIYSLVNHSDDRKVEQVLQYTLEAVYLLKCLELSQYFDSSLRVKDQSKYMVGGHILRNLMMMPCNAHECTELSYLPANLPESLTIEIGSGIYPVLSLINHSCDPNVVRHSYGNICVVRAIRNISKGSEVLDNYGALCALTPTPDRRVKLYNQYFFTCKCLACTDDYPQYMEIPSETPVFKCDACSGPVFLPLKHTYDIVPCSFCQHNHALRPRLSSLSQSDENYRMAMRDVLTSTCDNIDQSIIFLQEHLRLMDRLLCRPWRDYNDCQEALKQCYAYKASHYTVSEKSM
ncbi:hypothetical protein ACF0H5_015180 [Mactra antiquata]